MAISGTITVISPIAPTSDSDVYPVTLPKYGKGGLRTVANQAERLAITTQRREVGMMVYQIDQGIYYTLIGAIANDNWQQMAFVTTDGQGNIHISGNLIVTGFIQTSTGVQGDPDPDVEYLGNNMNMDMDCGTY